MYFPALIPTLLVDSFPQRERHKFHTTMGFFRFRAIQGVQIFGRKPVDPKPEQAPLPLWLTWFISKPHQDQRDSAKNLPEQVGAPSKTTWRRKLESGPTQQAIVRCGYKRHSARMIATLSNGSPKPSCCNP